MFRRATHRLTASLIVVLSMLFSQLALASYLCPGAPDTARTLAAVGGAEPCQGMDPAQPTLCHQHCADAAQSFEAVKVPTTSLPAIVQVLALPLVLDAGDAVAPPMAATAQARPPPEPLFLATLRLRV